MGSTDGCGISVDCRVGTIVWVRRRNGSWWPGRILGPDELSVSHLMSPRSGTPVKLLGREDASVDWYNLEKSKRVKAFRCGEFDACIERAEASHGTPIKKREKYARREDAILHALELEKKQLELQQHELGSSSNIISNKTTGSHKNEPANLYSPESYIRHDERVNLRSLSAHKQHNFLIGTDFSHEEENVNDSSYADKGRINKQFRWEDDNPEAIPRMRGLQDFGLRTAQPKRKLSQSVNWEDSGKPLAKHMQLYSSSGYMSEYADHASSSKNLVAVKRKRSQSGMVEESLFKKRDRRRPLVQVLQSSAKLAPHLFKCGYDGSGISMPVEKDHMQSIIRAKRSSCVYFPADSDGPPGHGGHGGHDSEHLPVLANQFGARNDLDNRIHDVEGYICTGLIEVKVSDSLEADYLEPDIGEDASMLTDTTHVLVPGSKDYEPPEFQIPEKFRSLDGYETPHSGIIPQLHEQITDASAEVGVSKWHMKGKRNTRNVGKRPVDAGDRKIYRTFAENCNGSMDEMACENKRNNLNIERVRLSNQKALSWGIIPKKESFYACDKGDLIDKDLAHNQLTVNGEWRNPLSLQSTKDDGRSHSSLNDSDNSHELAPYVWEVDVPSNLARSAFWEEPVECFHPVYVSHIDNEMETLLVDVDLKVEASYQGEHVPLVSLMSRLNGKAIIGHPVQIEMLENGSTRHLISKYNVGMDESAAPPPVWCTARRTAMQRVPRSNPLTAALEDEDPDMLQYSEHGSKPPVNRKAYSGYLSHQASLSKNSTSHARHSRSRKFQKKNSKKLSLPSQKTRTLASLATNEKLGGESRVKLGRSNDILEGLIKPEGSIPLVTCVPVKVVFSRLLEAVGRPSSAVAHRIRMNSPAVQAPS